MWLTRIFGSYALPLTDTRNTELNFTMLVETRELHICRCRLWLLDFYSSHFPHFLHDVLDYNGLESQYTTN